MPVFGVRPEVAKGIFNVTSIEQQSVKAQSLTNFGFMTALFVLALWTTKGRSVHNDLSYAAVRKSTGCNSSLDNSQKILANGVAHSSASNSAITQTADIGIVAFVKNLWAAINKDRIFAVSAGVAFYGLLSIVPALAAMISLYGLFTDRATIVSQIGRMSQFLPPEIASIIGDQAQRISSQPTQTLGFAFLISLLLSVWSSNAAMKAVFDALNVAFEKEEKRGVISLNLQSLGLTLAILVIGLFAIAAGVILPVILERMALTPVIESLLQIAVWPIMLILVSLTVAVLFRFGASRPWAPWRWLTPGVSFTTITWGLLSFGFSTYATNFGNFNETYGSLGAAAVLMTWLWFSTLLLLIGAEIDSIYYEGSTPENMSK